MSEGPISRAVTGAGQLAQASTGELPDPDGMDDATLLATLHNVAKAIDLARDGTDRLMDYRDDLYLAGRRRKARIKVNTLAETAGMTVGSVSVAIHRAESRAR